MLVTLHWRNLDDYVPNKGSLLLPCNLCSELQYLQAVFGWNKNTSLLVGASAEHYKSV